VPSPTTPTVLISRVIGVLLDASGARLRGR
jgi:hypothetical protein